jgi:hypothetical protein
MGTAEPLPSNLVDFNLATMVLLLGIFFIIVGITIAGVIYRESREWRKMILPMFDRDSSTIVPESSEEPGGLTPRMAAFGKEIFNRLFTHMDVAGLLGGAATVVLGIIVILISLYIGS